MAQANGYGDKSYWDQRYTVDEKYDWYLNYDQFKDQLLPHLLGKPSVQSTDDQSNQPANEDNGVRSKLRILNVGCGNSELSRSMYDDGFIDMLSIDYSEVVIEKMRATNADLPELKFEVQDVRELRVDNESVDAIIDKGTLDAILCGAESCKNSAAMLNECQRVLKPGGVLIVITYGAPASRLCYLEKRLTWRVQHEILGGTRYMFVCRKPTEAETKETESKEAEAQEDQS